MTATPEMGSHVAVETLRVNQHVVNVVRVNASVNGEAGIFEEHLYSPKVFGLVAVKVTV